MSDEYQKLGSVAQIQSGFAYPSTSYETSGIPIIRMSDLKKGGLKLESAKYVSEKWLTTTNEFALKEFDFVLGMSGSIENHAYVSTDNLPALLNQRVARLKLKSQTASYKYLCFWLSSDFYHRYAYIQGEGAAQKNISAKQIESFWIRLPEVREQKKIAAILTGIDTAIEKTETLIAKYQRIKAGMMHDLFTRGVLPNGQLRPPREQAPELYQETAIGWIPRGWAVCSVGSVLNDIQTGKSPSCREIPAISGDWGVLKVSAVHPGGFRSDQNKMIESVRLIDPSFEVKAGDLLITRANTPELVGMVCLVESPQPKLMLCDKTLRLIVNEVEYSKHFLFLSLQLHHVRIQIENAATGTSMSMKNISQAAIRNILISRPPRDEQSKIADIVETISVQLRCEETKRKKLYVQKSGLMHDLLTGKVAVKVTEPEVVDG